MRCVASGTSLIRSVRTTPCLLSWSQKQRSTVVEGISSTCTVWHWHNPIWWWCFLLSLSSVSQSAKLACLSLTLIPLMALTRVDLPWATWPIVPIFWVACLEIISGVSGVTFSMSSLSRDCWARWSCLAKASVWASIMFYRLFSGEIIIFINQQ